ncbi:Methyltransferase type 11 domain protein [Candidatus Magnetomorum sp. HK-1]|nr:Methyltransferase type 11 domain protein [Candidatus Magnetomorum sp. HK-1]
MKNDLQKMIEHEKTNWDKIFKAELNKNSKQEYSSFWWRNYYEELINYMDKILLQYDCKSVLEAGSGSGKATILLKNVTQKTLIDISPEALKYAQHLAKKFNSDVKYIEGNIFSMPFKNEKFDLVWSIGVVEHYNPKYIEMALKEAVRVNNRSGIIAVGIPNLFTGPIIKAWLSKKIKYIHGYKLETEKFYKVSEIKNIISSIANESGRKIEYIKTEYFGNPLIIETPEFILKTLGKPVSRIFKKNKFLKLIICKFKL